MYQSYNQKLFSVPNIIVIFCIFLILVNIAVTFSSYNNEFLFYSFGFVPAYFSTDSFFTILTYSFLHGGWNHLLLNLGGLLAFGSLLARKVNNFTFVLFWILSSAVGALFHYLLYPTSLAPLVGASGVVSAIIGLACRCGFWGFGGLMPATSISDTNINRIKYRSSDTLPLAAIIKNKFILYFIAAWVGVNILFSLINIFAGAYMIATDVHIICFIFGLLSAPLFVTKLSKI